MDGSCSDDSEIEEERAGGGPGPTGGGPEQEDRGRIRADDVYPEYWRSIHILEEGGDTPRASGHCMCVLHMHMGRYDRAEAVLTLFRSIEFQSYAVESQIRKANKRVSNIRCCIQALNSTNVSCCFTSVSRLDRLFIEQPRL
jgi:hypothetical protein